MRVIREVLRLAWGCGLSQRQTAISCRIARASVQDCLLKATAAGLSWPLSDDLDDSKLESLLYHKPVGRPKSEKAPLDFAFLHKELRSHKGMTLALLWQRYIERNSDGYQYSQFCKLYHEWSKVLDVVMRQEHTAGEKGFSDFAGSKLHFVDSDGVVHFAHLFVCALGASSFTFAKAYLNETAQSWCMGHAEAFAYFGGCPQIVVPDNPKPVVTKACPYEPDIHMDFLHMAQHFGVGVVPARVRRPQDKAKVEAAVKMATRWIIAVIKDRDFHSLAELNIEIARLLEILNAKPFKAVPGSRRSLFENLDRPALQPLPINRYDYTQIGFAKPALDYHICVDGCFYSVPFQYVKKRLEYRLNSKTLEVFFNGKRIASHVRRIDKNKPATLKEHMPPSHQKYLDWTPERITSWAASIGPETNELINRIFASREFPQQAFKSCLGILSLTKDFGKERLEKAASRAVRVGGYSLKTVRLILENNQEDLTLNQTPIQLRIENPNVRGPGAYISPSEIEVLNASTPYTQ